MPKKTQKLRKVLTLAACAVLLVSVTIVGTVAYLTSDDAVTNTFTVGNVVITMDETDVDTSGVKDSETRVKTNTYKLLPGHTYTKDPVVHVTADSEKCYVFVQVINGISKVEADTKIAAQIEANGWTKLDNAGVDGDVYYKVSDNTGVVRDLPVFNTVSIKGDVDHDELAAITNKKVVVNAYAIQYDGFADAAAAWTAGNASAANGGWLE